MSTMEFSENLFNAGKFVECSKALEALLNVEGSTADDGKLLYYFEHNKIVTDALSHDWFDEETNHNELHHVWCATFTKLTNLCDKVRCNLLISKFGHEVFSVATLNLLSWSWENLGDHFDGYFDQINRLTMYSLQTELASCGESALNPQDVLHMVELLKQCIWRTSPQQCNVLLQTICLYFLHMLRFERNNQKLTQYSEILQEFLKILPQISIHLTSKTSAKKTPSLFLLGPNVASSKNNPNLTVNLVFIVTVLYLLKLDQSDKALHLLEESNYAKDDKLDGILEYLKALVCLQCNQLDKALYHINIVSTFPMETHMIKRRNILCGYLYIRKGDYDTALERLRDSTDLPEDEDQLPIHVYLMAQAYGFLGQSEQELVLLGCVAEVLREDPRYSVSRVTPISSVQNRLLRCVHQQPELNLFQTLVAIAEVAMKTSKPGKASDCLLEALRQTKCYPGSLEKTCDFVKVRSFRSVMKDTVVSLLKSGDLAKARILCDGLMDLPSQDSTSLGDAISRILLSDALPENQSDKKQAVLLEAVRLLKKQKELNSKNGGGTPHAGLIDTLISRAFYRKAKLYASNGYNDDATAYFKRALAFKEEDEVILRGFQRHLIIMGKADDAKTVLEKIRELPKSSHQVEKLSSEGDITLNYLLNENWEKRSS